MQEPLCGLTPRRLSQRFLLIGLPPIEAVGKLRTERSANQAMQTPSWMTVSNPIGLIVARTHQGQRLLEFFQEDEQFPQIRVRAGVASTRSKEAWLSPLYHYTDENGMHGIVRSNQIRASTSDTNTNNARYGSGQYFSDIVPGTKTSAQLARIFLNHPALKSRFTHFVAIKTKDLEILLGRPRVYFIPGDAPLDLTDRIVASGLVPTPFDHSDP